MVICVQIESTEAVKYRPELFMSDSNNKQASKQTKTLQNEGANSFAYSAIKKKKAGEKSWEKFNI